VLDAPRDDALPWAETAPAGMETLGGLAFAKTQPSLDVDLGEPARQA
jgi:hypothetical protein